LEQPTEKINLFWYIQLKNSTDVSGVIFNVM